MNEIHELLKMMNNSDSSAAKTVADFVAGLLIEHGDDPELIASTAEELAQWATAMCNIARCAKV